MGDQNRYKRHLNLTGPIRRFDENEVSGFMIGDNALTLNDYKVKYGIDIVKAFNNAPDSKKGLIKMCLFCLQNNITGQYKVEGGNWPVFDLVNRVSFSLYPKYKIYVNGKFYKNANMGDTIDFGSSENSNNYIIMYFPRMNRVLSSTQYLSKVTGVFCGYFEFFHGQGSLGEQMFFTRGRRYLGKDYPKLVGGASLKGDLYVDNGFEWFSLQGWCRFTNYVYKIRLPKTIKGSTIMYAFDYDSLVNCTKIIYEGNLEDWKNISGWLPDNYHGGSKDLGVPQGAGKATLYINDSDDPSNIPTEIDFSNDTVINKGVICLLKQFTNCILPDNQIVTIGMNAFKNCTNLSVDITNKFLQTTSIGDYAFYKCKVYGVYNAPNMVSIGSYVFIDCKNITGEIDFTNLTSVGNYAFDGCSNLGSGKVLNIPGTFKTIRERCFTGTGYTSLVLNEGITTLKARCFSVYTKPSYFVQDEIIIPNSVTSIENYTFEGINIKRWICNQQCSTIPYCFLWGTPLVYLDFGEYITKFPPDVHEPAMPLHQNGAIVLRGNSIPQYYNTAIPNIATATLFCKSENLALFQSTWNTFANYIGFTMVDNLPLSANEGEYYYQNLDNHIYKYENSAWTDITATYV